MCTCAYLVYEPELHELGGERGRGVAARDGARQLPVHLVVHAQQDGHLRQPTTNLRVALLSFILLFNTIKQW